MGLLLPRDCARHPDVIPGESSVAGLILGALVSLYKEALLSPVFQIVLAALRCFLLLSGRLSCIEFGGKSLQGVFVPCQLVHPSLIVLGYSIFEDSQLEEVEKASSEFSSLVSNQDYSDKDEGHVEVLS